MKVVRLADIEHTVCELFGLSSSDLKSSRRTRSLSQPRMFAMYLARKHTRAAYSEIGEYFGGRNHSTVIAAEQKIQEWLTHESSLKVASQTWKAADLLEALEQQLLAS
jgi:chromosomal replication initiator protein